MKTKPILFSTPMVQAILEGRKTQTRRIIKDHSQNNLLYCGTGKKYWAENPNDLSAKYYKCPSEIGQIIWVRETFCPVVDAYTFEDKGFKYRADKNTEDYNGCWKPSIFMPKEAARIFLKVTNIRIERLQDISENDAIREGVESIDNVYYDYLSDRFYRNPYESFCTLWTKINGKESWNQNPFVWVYEFELTEKPENFA